MAKHKVKQGECILSIAENNGFFWETLWKLPENTELKQKRKDPNVLSPGDEVFIPDKQEKTENCATEQKHQFRKKGGPALIRLRLLDFGKPRANLKYTLDIDGQLFSGTTDKQGHIEHFIPPDAQKGALQLGKNREPFDLNLGAMDPIDTIEGVQKRLNNLGFDCCDPNGVMNEETKYAIKEFQKKYQLTEDGQVNAETRDKLKEIHGC
jgi:N-acetylmuramoyl-L-alanine amidase